MKRINKKGFTLVELLAVIVILALLMIVAARAVGNSITTSRQKAIESEAKKLVSKVYEEIQLYLLDGTTNNFAYAKADSSFKKPSDILNASTSGYIRLEDGEYNAYIQAEKDADDNIKLSNFCIDDGKSLQYTGTISSGNVLSSLSITEYGGCNT